MKPYSFLNSGDVASNRAAIYFDFNDPIITNTVTNTFVATLPTCFVGVNESEKIGFNLYPNPSSQLLTINISDLDLTNAELKMVDMLGKEIFKSKLNQNTTIISTSEFANGVYFIQVKADNKLETQKLLIQH